MQAPLEQQARARIILWFGGTLTDSKIKTAIWLLLTCPDYQGIEHKGETQCQRVAESF